MSRWFSTPMKSSSYAIRQSDLYDSIQYAMGNIERNTTYKTREEVLQEQLTEKFTEITMLNERISYLEAAILELEGDKNA